ncbi:hypothetical protein U27_05469 [Candidatus Vecturithrix granuli]|uniref:Uncharacterized protein n=1 Tax=Vecturithrix granuli TaxID=1499967 RepID=A0A081C1P0_VECG1|nr:hypothetical protein U27_05469 [Candidatus Vecturithrix granuli]
MLHELEGARALLAGLDQAQAAAGAGERQGFPMSKACASSLLMRNSEGIISTHAYP